MPASQVKYNIASVTVCVYVLHACFARRAYNIAIGLVDPGFRYCHRFRFRVPILLWFSGPRVPSLPVGLHRPLKHS